MAEHKVGKVRIERLNDFLEFVLVFHHGVDALVAPVAPGVVFNRGLAVSYVIIGSDNVAGLQIADDHVQITAGMFAEAVDELDDALRLAGRYVDPSVDGISLVK